jgi:hypothetical protein
MQNAVIGFPRWTDRAVFSAGGGAFQAGYPVGNLAELPLSRAARTATAAPADARFQAILDKPRAMRLLALVNHNGSLDGQFRIRLYADQTLAEPAVFDSGWLAFWPPVYPSQTLEWEDDQWWSGQYSTEEIAGYRATRPIWLDRLYLAQGLRVEIRDPGNPDGFFQCGLFEIAQGWRVGVNFQIGAEHGFRARSQALEALGGVRYFDRREKPRVFSGSIDYLPRDEALARAFEHQRQSDLDRPFLWLPDPDATIHLLRQCWLARNAELGLMRYASFDRDSATLKFEEVL